MREVSEDGASSTGRKRKEPVRDYREKDRDRERHREPEREVQRGKEYERDRTSRHYQRGHDEYEGADRRSSRDYPREREREERGKDHTKEPEKEKEPYRSSKHHREPEKDDRRRDRKIPRSTGREWEETSTKREEGVKSGSAHQEEPKEKRELTCDEKVVDERADKARTLALLKL